MRLVALVALIALAFAPVARAGCGVTSTALIASAPLAVTLTAQCASSTYTWDFGDGTTATGQTMQHVFAAGSWLPGLTSNAGIDALGPVTSISLQVSAPKRAKYAAHGALRARFVPRIPVTYRGRRFQHGLLRVRVLGPGPYTVHAGNVAAAVTLV